MYNVYLEKNARQVSSEVVEIIHQDIIEEESEETSSNFIYEQYEVNENLEMPTKEIDGVEYIATVEIPALNLDLPVASTWSYSLLTITPCRYTGSVYTNDLVIAAHNYTSHFGTLKNLTTGDSVIITDMDNNVFEYEVAQIEIIEPTDIEQMTTADDWDLTLFTCNYGGSVRITVRCVLVSD
ncbi:MAG: sortase [Clostridia bacterium]